jgi:branched-chain amino acid aminotransferase
VTPVASVDKVPVGTGKRGPITTAIQRRYLDYVQGKLPDVHGWRTAV